MVSLVGDDTGKRDRQREKLMHIAEAVERYLRERGPTNKAGNSSAAARYNGLAPTKSEIFNKDMAGKSISIGCWIGRTVTVPSL